MSVCKRILKAIDEDGSSSTRACEYASEGVMYTQTCLHKYKRQYYFESSMPLPLDLTADVSTTAGS